MGSEMCIRDRHCTRTIALQGFSRDAVGTGQYVGSAPMDKWKAALEIARSGESKYKILVQAIADDIEQGVLVNGSAPATATAGGRCGGHQFANGYQRLHRTGTPGPGALRGGAR